MDAFEEMRRAARASGDTWWDEPNPHIGSAPYTPPPPRRDRGRLRAALFGVVVVGAGVAAYLYAPGGAEREAAPLEPTQAVDSSTASSYAFIATEPDGSPVTYNSCTPISWSLDPAGGPAEAERVADDAFASVAAATGLDFTRVESGGTIAVRYEFEAEDGELVGETVGYGGSTALTAGNSTRFTDGTIVLETEAFSRLDAATQLAVVKHELGHVVGLDHVDDPAQLMYPSTTSRLDWNAGDLAGLAQLGGSC